MEQYKRDRNPRERLFELGRCLAHFAVDEHEVKFCTQLAGQGLVVSAVQPGLERRGGEPAEPERAEDGLPVEAGAVAGQPDEHHRELRADCGVEGPEDRKQEAHADLAAVSPVGGGAAAADRRVSERRGDDVPDPALGGEREVELDCVAGPPADRAGAGGRDGLRFGDRGDRPQAAGPADPGHDQAVRAGGVGGGSRVDLGQPAGDAADGQADRDHDGPEVPVHPEGHRRRAPGAPVRDHHRRGALEPGRTDVGGGVDGAQRERQRRGRRRDDRRQDQPADGVEAAAQRTPATSPSRPRRRTRRWRSSARRTPTTGTASTGPSTPTR